MFKDGSPITTLIIAIFSFTIVVLVLFVTDKPREQVVEDIVREVIIKRLACPNSLESFNSLKNPGRVVSLAEGLNSYGVGGIFVKNKIGNIKIDGSGSQIACGYLYVEAHTNLGPLQDEWEHSYIKLGDFGGHIVIDNAIINKKDDNKTTLLFNLDDINYRERLDSIDIKKANWSALLNVTDKISFIVALSATNKSAILDKVSIAYKCWNPETGLENQDCQLLVE